MGPGRVFLYPPSSRPDFSRTSGGGKMTARQARDGRRAIMPKKTLRELEQRLEHLEQEVAYLRQRLSDSPPPGGAAHPPPDLDATLDHFFEALGVRGELS